MRRLLSFSMACLLCVALFAQQEYTLTLKTSPQAIAAFYTCWNDDSYHGIKGNEVKVPAGVEVTVTLQVDYGLFGPWKVTEWRALQGSTNLVVTTNSNEQVKFIMPATDLSLATVMEYNPDNPDNPQPNAWYPDDGLLVIDYLNNQSVRGIANNLVGDDSQLVRSIVVGGYTTSWVVYDLSTDRFPNLNYIDLSRLNYHYPYSDKTTYDLNDASFHNLPCTELLLPSNIESIGYHTFEGTYLERLTIYAITPPRLAMEDVSDDDGNVIGQRQAAFPSSRDMVVYVPEESLPLYQSAEGWKEFELYPIVEDGANITVNIDAGSLLNDYQGLTLELQSVKSLFTRSMIMSNRTDYTFPTVPKQSTYNVRLLSRTGNVIAQQNNIFLGDDDLRVTLSGLKRLCALNLQVSAGGTAIDDSKYSCLWLDAQGRVLSRSNQIKGILEDEPVQALITLTDTELKKNYRQRDTLTISRPVDNPTINFQLKVIPNYRLLTEVLRADGQFMGRQTVQQSIYRITAEGSVLVSEQSFNSLTAQGGISSLQPETLLEGTYDIAVRVDGTTLSTATQRIALTSDQNVVFRLKEANGSTVRISWMHYGVAAEGVDASSVVGTTKQISDAAITLHDVTNGRQLTGFSMNPAGVVRLQEQLEPGTEVELTLGNRDGRQFAPAIVHAKADAEGNLSMNAVTRDYGSLAVSFRSSNCSSVSIRVFDASGAQVAAVTPRSNTATIQYLKDNVYTVAIMENNSITAALTHQNDLERFLRQDVDYVAQTIAVNTGTIVAASFDVVPMLSSNSHLYTDEQESRLTCRSQVNAGCYQTLSTRVSFRPEYRNRISDVKLVFTLPNDLHFVDGSVIMDGFSTPYTVEDGKIIVPAIDHKLVRFCVIPLTGGLFTPTAKMTFLLDGELCEQPLTSGTFMVNDASLQVPDRSAQEQIAVSGIALPSTPVTVFVNDEVAGTTTSNVNGDWHMTLQLTKNYNLGVNTIYAQYNSQDGYTIKTPVSEVMFNRYSIYAEQVTMSHYNGWMRADQTVTFDLTKNTVFPTSYSFYHTADFTFDIKLSVSDTTYVDLVRLYVWDTSQRVQSFDAKFNKATGTWVVVQPFSSAALPTNVSVSIEDSAPHIFGQQGFSERLHFVDNLMADTRSAMAEVQLQLDQAEKEEQGSDAQLQIIGDVLSGIGIDPNDDAGYGDYPHTEEGFQRWQADAEAALTSLDALEKEYDLYGPNWSIPDLTPFNEQGIVLPGYTVSKPSASTRQYFEARSRGTRQAEEDGYVEYYLECEDGHYIFLRMSESGYTMVDLNEDLQVTVDFSKLSPELDIAVEELRQAQAELLTMQARGPLYAGDDGFVQKIIDVMEKVRDAMTKLGNVYNQWCDWMEFGAKKCEEAYKLINKDTQRMWVLFHKCEKDWGARAPFIYDTVRKRAEKAMGKVAELKELKGMFEKLKYCKWLGPLFGAMSLYDDYTGFVQMCEEAIAVYYAIPDPCPKDQAKADAIRRDLVGWGSVRIVQKGLAVVADITSLVTTITGLIGSVPSGGWSVAIGAGLTIGISATNFVGGLIFDYAYSDFFTKLRARIAELNCYCKKGDPDCDCPPGSNDPKCCKKDCCTGPGCNNNPPPPSITPIMDPSGYIYEAVASNRVPDALASVYYKELYEDPYGDTYEQVKLWDAEQFAQVNPMLTDENGEYGWDVPAGLWQVRVVKDGYLPTESEWLPVPPPQLDVNLAMTQPTAPVVGRVVASEQGVEVRFDKYMKPVQLTPNNIFLTKNGQQMEGTIHLIDAEQNPDSTKSYARCVIFQPKQQLAVGQKVRLTVKAGIESYANVGMEQDFTQEFDVEQRVTELVANSNVGILYGEEHTLQLSALPAKAAAGKKVLVNALNPDIVQVKAESVTFDNEGHASLTFSGTSYGTTALRFTLADDPEVEAYTIVGVRDSEGMMTRIPTASLISGVEVKYGTTLRLSCPTPDAVIYYTTDGTCPCDNPDRLRYDGAIILTHDVTIKAVAEAPGYAESDVATFTYKVYRDPQGIDNPEVDGSTEPVYNMQGVKMQDEQQLRKGIYLRRGNKVVIK